MPRLLTRRPVVAAVAAMACAGAAVAVAQSGGDGRIGPDRGILNNGRHLHPFGAMTKVGQFPTGGAVTPNGRFYWTVSTGRGQNDVRIVSVRSGKAIQTLRLPGASGGIVMDPKHAKVYVSGVADSSHKDQQTPDGTAGKEGDVVHVFGYRPGSGRASETGTIKVPPPSDAAAPQDFPPAPQGKKVAWPDRLAIAPDGGTLLVPLNLADQAAVVDVSSQKVRYVKTGSYPYGAAILRDGKTGLVSNEADGTVSVIDLAGASKVKDIQVGPKLSHPEGIAVDPKTDRAYVAVANSDQVAVIDTHTRTVERTLSVERPAGLGTAPVDVTTTPGGELLLVAESGADQIGVYGLPSLKPGAHKKKKARHREVSEAEAEATVRAAKVSSAWRRLGSIPTAQYPTDVEAVGVKARNPCGRRTAKTRSRKARRCAKLLWLSGKGLGTGANPNGPNPQAPSDSDDNINQTQYLPLLNIGNAAVADFPSGAKIKQLTPIAEGQVKPSDPETAPADTPLRAGGPIKHVFYIVRENRSYDQVLGDDERGDADPKLTLFGNEVTPNAHALVRRFPLLDHVYANSEASIDGHFWTSAAKVSDYTNKAWFQNYGGRGRPYDFGVYAVTWPANGFLFDQAERQGISYFNYGEAVAGTIGLFPDKDRDEQANAEVQKKFAKSDLGPNGCYANDSSIGVDSITGNEVYDSSAPLGAKPGATSRFDCFQKRFLTQTVTNSVPTFNYMVLTNDHTRTLQAGARTPRSMIADNDEALGKIVDTISHSPIWKESAIFVVEDDSQDGADHVDAHRIPALVISPFAKQGAVVHRRYDFLSFIKSMELIMGMKPLGLWDELAVPMYDAFGPNPDNADPYAGIPSNISLTERNPSTGAGAREASRLPRGVDRASQADMDRLLWKSVHGWGSNPPPPGPGAEGADKRVLPGG